MDETGLNELTLGDFEAFLRDCTERIVEDKSERGFLDWLAFRISRQLGTDADPQAAKALALSLGREFGTPRPCLQTISARGQCRSLAVTSPARAAQAASTNTAATIYRSSRMWIRN